MVFRVPADDFDLPRRNAQYLRRDLAQQAVRPGPHFGRARDQNETAVQVHLQGDGRTVQRGFPAAGEVNAAGHPDPPIGFRVLPLLGPTEPLRRFLNALFQTTAFQDGAGGGFIPRLHGVAQTDFDRVQSQFRGQEVHLLFLGERDLRIAEAAHRAAGRMVRINENALGQIMGQAVERSAQCGRRP